MGQTIQEVLCHQCTGCGACLNKCPVHAIDMITDKEGFPFPKVDEHKCINCGLCLKTCPVIEPKYKNTENSECYAVMAKDEIRKHSSSGGVFSLLANWMFSQNGVVCGAAYTENCYGVEHIIIDCQKDLYKLQGSKYVQSNAGMVYLNIRNYLEKNVPVLFTGTPCQVAALNSFLNKEYNHLYTVDLVCHGVPSPQFYSDYIKQLEFEQGSKASEVKFRGKEFVDWNPSMTVYFKDGSLYHKKRNEDPYLVAFLKLLTLRKSCGDCPFAKLPRQGDMTIADFWDVDRFNPKFDDRKGTSAVLTNNEKGRRLLDVLRKTSILCEPAPLEHAIKYNAQIKYSSRLHGRRDRFFDLYANYAYNPKKAIDYGLNRKFDIGYIGWWYGANYGSVLTSFAMNRVLTSMGKSVLMLEWPIVNGKVPEKKPNSPARRFAKDFYEESWMYPISEYGRFNYHCDAFVVGSDQLWNWYSNKDVGTYYFFLDFVDDRHKKIAYSTSFGHEYVHYPEDMRIKVSYYLQRFDAISVREKSAVNVCHHDFDVDAVQTMDPVFLCDMKSYEDACALSKLELDKPYVLAYILNPTEEKIKAVRLAAEAKRLPYYIILDGQANHEEQKKLADDPNVLPPIEIADWLNYIKNAEFVVTDSFHGYCYSIIFKRDVAVFPNKLRGLARFETISELANLNDRLVYSFNEFEANRLWEKQINYAEVEARMNPEIERSRKWLKDALEMRKNPPSVKELYLWKAMEFDKLAHILKTEGVILKEDLESIEQASASRDNELRILKDTIQKQNDEIQQIKKQMDKYTRIPRAIKKYLKFLKKS